MASGNLPAMSKSILGRLASRTIKRAPAFLPVAVAKFGTASWERDEVSVSASSVHVTHERRSALSAIAKNGGEIKQQEEAHSLEGGACTTAVHSDEEEEQEDMFVEAHESFQFKGKEWGGPTRGGRLPEPTRYGDWERKGRCSDF